MANVTYKPFWSKKEVNILLKKYAPLKKTDLPGSDPGCDYYEFPDGKLLIVFGGPGTMYHSIDELNEVLNKPPIRKNGEHFLSNLIPDEKLFLNSVDQYIDTLADKLKIKRAKLDKSQSHLV